MTASNPQKFWHPLRFSGVLLPLLVSTVAHLVLASATGAGGDDDFDLVQDKHECVPITMSLCKDIGYNHTVFPNLVGIENQRDADEQLQTYQPLIKIHCSSQLRFFLCSVYAPMCTEKIEKKIGPCRPLCEAVKQRCEPMLKQFGFEWPSLLDCEQFPGSNDDGNMCMIGPGESKANNNTPIIKPITGGADGTGGQVDMSQDGPIGNPQIPSTCPNSYGNMIYINNSGRCSPRCPSEMLFTEAQQRVALIWMGCLSGICVILSLVALLAVLVSSFRFRFPERPLIAINICYVFSSISYLIRIFSGHASTACTLYGGVSVLVIQGLQNLRCTFLFLFQYYFSLMGALWWLVLCLTWCLSVAPGWSPEAMERYSRYYLIVACVAPGLLTVVVLVRQSVEADELTGMCNVGNVNTEELMHFVILPLMACLVLGMALLTVGFLSALCCCNKWVSSEKPGTAGAVMQYGGGAAGPLMGSNASSSGTAVSHRHHTVGGSTPIPLNPNGNKFDRSLLKLGAMIFSYLIPSTCLLAACFYEWLNRRSWSMIGSKPRVGGNGVPANFLQSAEDYFHQQQQQHFGSALEGGSGEFGAPHRDSSTRFVTGGSHYSSIVSNGNHPNFDAFIMKIVASIIWGIISAVWLIFRIVGYHCGRYPHPSKSGLNNCSGGGGSLGLAGHMSGGVTGMTGASSCGDSHGNGAGCAGSGGGYPPGGGGVSYNKLNQHNAYLQQSLLMNQNAAAAAAAANCGPGGMGHGMEECLLGGAVGGFPSSLRNHPQATTVGCGGALNSSKLLNRSYSPGNGSGHLAPVLGGFSYDPRDTTLI